MLALGFLVALGIFLAPLVLVARHSARIAALEGERAELMRAVSSLLERVFALEHAAPRQSAAYRAMAIEAPLPRETPPAPVLAASVAPAWEPLPAQLPLFSDARPRVRPAPAPVSEAIPVPLSEPAPRRTPDISHAPDPLPREEPAPAPRIEWEQWIGVRGAAALGAGILVIALLFFVRYSMDQGWLSPTLRVVFGAAFSAAILGVAQARLHDRYRVLASWLSGAGVAGLFASLWAGHQIVPLLGPASAFVAFVALAAGCLALASFRDSMPIALLGAGGGFAAPLAIAANHDRPLAVIAYVLVLDAALLALALKRRWWVLSALAMLASSAYEAVWLSAHASSGIAPLHVAIVIVFAALFAAVPAFSAESVAEPPTSPARLMRLAAMAVPFLFALELVSHPAVVAAPMPIGALLVSVTLLACGLARARREPHGLMLVALGSLAILYAWSRQAILADHVPAIAGLALALALPFVVLALVERRTLGLVRDRAGAAGATMIAALTLLLAVAAATSKAPSPLALGVLTLLAGAGLALSRWAGVTSFASVSLAGGAGTLGLVGGSALVFSGETRPAILSLLASLALATLGAWLARRDERRGPLAASVAAWVEAVRSGVTVASIAPAVLLLPLAERLPLLLFGGLLAASVASGMAHAYRAPLAHTRIALVLGAPLAAFALRGHADTSALVIVAACLALAVIAASFSTRLGLAGHAATPLANSAVIVCGAAAIALRMADSSDAGALTTSVAVTASGVLLASWHLAPTSRAEAERWLGGLAVTAATVSMVLLLRNEELTWGLSLLGLALLGLGTKLRRDAAVVVGVIHLGVVAVRLLANPWVLGYHPRGDVALLNWITPTYLVPTLAMAAGWWLLSQPNADDLESDHHLVRRILAGLALTLPFAWLNLTVIDIYASGPWLSLAGAASDGRNLSISAVWASYGVGLLLLGLARKSVPLRWASLALILVTAGKVFMYDLGNLRDLYRVASLAGLAISLLAISVLYQRFVFGPSAKEKVVRAS